jgi:hypothetical protein
MTRPRPAQLNSIYREEETRPKLGNLNEMASKHFFSLFFFQNYDLKKEDEYFIGRCS